jgi:hypothetical protein
VIIDGLRFLILIIARLIIFYIPREKLKKVIFARDIGFYSPREKV